MANKNHADQTKIDEAYKEFEKIDYKDFELGIAGKLTKAFITSPLSIIIFFAMLGAGIIGLISTPRQEDPQISVPLIDLFVEYPGASSEEVSNIIVKPLERLISNILGVKHVYSVSDKSQGIITVEFDVGQEMNASIIKVRDKMLANLDFMPPGAKQPLIKPKEIDDVPIINLTLWSKSLDDGQLRSLGLELLQQLAKVKDTNNGFIVGGRKEIFHIDAYPGRLAGYGISIQQIASTVGNANVRGHTGNIELNGFKMEVYAGDFFNKVEDIENLVITVSDGKPIYVRDVADVYYAPEDAEHMVSYYTGKANKTGKKATGEQAVTIAIAKKYGTNGVEVAQNILAKVEALKGRLIPDNVEVSVTRNYGESAKNKVNALIKKLFIATGAVTVLVWFALGIRPAIVVTLVIPVVLLMTIFSAWMLGMTIDRVSLFALIFSIGILVDDAIVVTENIYRRWLIDNKITIGTAIDAVREVGNPTILATFTVVAALVPMAAVSGMMGPYMAPIPVLGSVAMMFSLFAAFVFTPYFIMVFAPPLNVLRKMHKKEKKEAKIMFAFFHSTISKLFNTKIYGWSFLIGLVVTFFISMSMFYTTSVPVKMLPLDNKSEFGVVLDMPDGTALANTASTLHKMAQVLRNMPEVVAIQSYSGTAKPFDFNGLVRHYYLRQTPSEGELQIQLVEKSERDRSSHEIALEARTLVKQIAEDAGANYAIVEMPPGPPVLRPVVAEVYGPDKETRRKLANDLTELFKESGTMTDVDNLMRDKYPVIDFQVDTAKASRFGVSVMTIKETLSMAMGSFNVGTIRLKNALEPSHICLQIPLSKRSQLSYLTQLPVPSQHGGMIPISELGSFSYKKQDDLIFHKDLADVEYVLGEPKGRLSAPIYAMMGVDDLLLKYQTIDGKQLQGEYLGPPTDQTVPSFEWTGEWTITYETFRDMGSAFAVALVVIYMLVVWQFGNFIIPAVIMAPIPLTLLGIVPGHWLLGAEFTATSMIGWIALAGIIVRNSILLVDFTVQEYAKGMPFFDAVINSCSSRTRPIMITAFALVGGSSVILSDPIFQGMAISLSFGVLISTVLTLIVIPLGTLSAGEAACRNIAVNMGLLPGDADADAKYNVEKPVKVKKSKFKKIGKDPKEWIKMVLGKKNQAKEASSKKIDTNKLLKKEDKSDL
ncbi:RND family efflux transporter inner membrane protein [Isorropodon fossajaponicum endosymbiont JTNG4]|uniref:efflux RND transporter permease subunit n=1 Tax=Isorropodon fossajaponicum symbiont TaxID=883811 RepID=UPI001916B5BD|nr:efflux RND transporter permease subunit [Isorropodon fossajaponicum symbiont]BBB24234.1 RND family efflux transporter inner membrane protein [Isorropodon fossajaponicum endosymbiont JTNG4]